MNDLIWKLKQFLRQCLPIALILAVVYGGYTMYKKGTFRRGLKPAISSVLHKVPFFGSRFGHYGGGKKRHYAYYKKKGKRRYGRRYHRRHRRRR